MSELKKKTINGLFWTFGQQFGFQFINFFVSIILARLLLPAEYGLIAMIAIFIAIGNSLVDGGMASSLIRTENPDQKDYSTVFFTNLSFSILVYVVVFFSAPLIADFYDQPILTSLTRLYSIAFIIRAFSSVQATKLNKEMNFKTQLIINIPSLIVGSCVGIYLAYSGYGVWSLVWMNLVQYTIATLQLWIWSKWSPSFIYERELFLKHFKFGYKLTLSGLLDTLIKNTNRIFIGKLFPPAQLGFFDRAKSMQELPVNNISSALKKVTYPLFASINDEEKLKSIYRKFAQQFLFWVVPVLVIAIIIAKPLFIVLLTEKWVGSVPYFQILCLAGIVMPVNTYNLNILLVKGKSGLFFRLGVVRNTLTLAGMLFIFVYGIYGLLWGVVVASYIIFIINLIYCGKELSISLTQQLKDVLPILLLGLGVGVIGFFLNFLLSDYITSNFLVLIILTPVLFSLYVITAYMFKMSAMKDAKQLLLKKKKNGKKK